MLPYYRWKVAFIRWLRVEPRTLENCFACRKTPKWEASLLKVPVLAKVGMLLRNVEWMMKEWWRDVQNGGADDVRWTTWKVEEKFDVLRNELYRICLVQSTGSSLTFWTSHSLCFRYNWMDFDICVSVNYLLAWNINIYVEIWKGRNRIYTPAIRMADRTDGFYKSRQADQEKIWRSKRYVSTQQKVERKRKSLRDKSQCSEHVQFASNKRMIKVTSSL